MARLQNRVFKLLLLPTCLKYRSETFANVFYIFHINLIRSYFLQLHPTTMHTLHPITNLYIYSIIDYSYNL